MARNDIHELMRSMSYDDRLCALVCSVIRTKQEALASCIYLAESMSVMTIGLSSREKAILVARARDIIDEIERDAMLKEVKP